MNKAIGQIYVVAAVLLPTAAHCEISEEVYCFNSSGAGANNFGLHVLYDEALKWSGAFVKYSSAKAVITLVVKDERSDEINPGRPDEVLTTWYEVYGGRITGEYEMMSQGANVYSMIYKNYTTHKKVPFTFNPDALVKNGSECVW